MPRHQQSNMSGIFTHKSAKQGDLFYTPEEDHDTSTEDQDYMDASNVLQTEAWYDPNSSQKLGPAATVNHQIANGSEEEELNRRRSLEEGT